MTTIVGYIDHEGRTWVGADRLVTTGGYSFRVPGGVCKLLRAGPWVVGLAGSTMLHVRLKARLEVLAEQDDAGWVGEELLALVRAQGWEAEKGPGDPPRYSMAGVIGRDGELWELEPTGLVSVVEGVFVSVGSGWKYAYGAWCAARDIIVSDGRRMVEGCLSAAAAFDCGTGGGTDVWEAGPWARPVVDEARSEASADPGMALRRFLSGGGGVKP